MKKKRKGGKSIVRGLHGKILENMHAEARYLDRELRGMKVKKG